MSRHPSGIKKFLSTDERHRTGAPKPGHLNKKMSQISRDKKGLLSTAEGTFHFFAPEALEGSLFSGYAADVWALGVMLYCMVTGRLPFFGASIMDLFSVIENSSIFYPDTLSPSLRALLERLLDRNPDTRIKLDDVMQEPWVDQGCHRQLHAVSSRHLSIITVDDAEIENAITHISDRVRVVVAVRVLANRWKKRALHKGGAACGGTAALEAVTESDGEPRLSETQAVVADSATDNVAAAGGAALRRPGALGTKEGSLQRGLSMKAMKHIVHAVSAEDDGDMLAAVAHYSNAAKAERAVGAGVEQDDEEEEAVWQLRLVDAFNQ